MCLSFQFVVAALLAVAAAMPQEYQDQDVQGSNPDIVRQEFNTNEDGSSWTSVVETRNPEVLLDYAGETRQYDNGEYGAAQQGTIQFTAPDEDGNPVQVNLQYIADDKGNQVTGEGLPVAPEDPNAQAQADAWAKYGGVDSYNPDNQQF